MRERERREGGELERHRERESERASQPCFSTLCLSLSARGEGEEEGVLPLLLLLLLSRVVGVFWSYSLVFFPRFGVWKSTKRRATFELIKAAPI